MSKPEQPKAKLPSLADFLVRYDLKTLLEEARLDYEQSSSGSPRHLDQKDIAAVRRQAPAQLQLIDSRANLLKAEPMRLLSDLMERGVLPKGRLCQLWADSLGVAYVNPTAVAVPTDGFEQLPVDTRLELGCEDRVAGAAHIDDRTHARGCRAVVAMAVVAGGRRQVVSFGQRGVVDALLVERKLIGRQRFPVRERVARHVRRRRMARAARGSDTGREDRRFHVVDAANAVRAVTARAGGDA